MVAKFSRRTLTGFGAVVLVSAAGLLGVLVDQALSGQPGLGFGTLLCLGSVLAAARIRVHQLRVSVVLVPLVYAGALAVAGLLAGDSAGTTLAGPLSVAFTDAVVNTPWLLAATGLAALVALVRWAQGRRAATARRSSGGSANANRSSAVVTSSTRG